MLSEWAFSSFLVKSLQEISNNHLLKSELINNLDVIKFELKYHKPVITYQTLMGSFLKTNDKINTDDLGREIADIYNKKYPNITIKISSNNWLEFQPNYYLLTDWLSQLLFIRWEDFPKNKQNNHHNNCSFNDYYIFVRFASILRSANAQKYNSH